MMSIQFRNWNWWSIPIPELELIIFKMELELRKFESELRNFDFPTQKNKSTKITIFTTLTFTCSVTNILELKLYRTLVI